MLFLKLSAGVLPWVTVARSNTEYFISDNFLKLIVLIFLPVIYGQGLSIQN
jgi:hypothetical protein